MSEFQEAELKRRLQSALGIPGKADFENWRSRHADAIAHLNPVVTELNRRRRRMFVRIATWSVAAAVLIGVCLGVLSLNAPNPDASAFAAVVQQIQKARTIAWKWTFYEHDSTKDGEHTWLKEHLAECAFKAPGLYREVRFSDDGQVESVEIRDTVHGRELRYFPSEKKATLSEFEPWSNDHGPFAYFLEKLDTPSLQWIAKRNTASGEVNVFRNAFRDHDNDRNWSIDFWIESKTKKLAAIYQPGADIYDPENDAARNSQPGKAFRRAAMGDGKSEIRYDVALDDSLFRLEPPDGYAVEVKTRERVTEKEMIDYLGIVADFNDKTFPDSPIHNPSLLKKINRALEKPEEDRTEAERKLIETDMRYSWRFVTTGNAPILVFFYWDPDTIVKDSFRYLGHGVKLGENDRIVCWYKLKDAKDPTTYRVVYGDLSVQDVAADQLPLPVAN